jgi:hypothetical protein
MTALSILAGKQKLHGSWIARPLVDQRSFCASQRVRPKQAWEVAAFSARQLGDCAGRQIRSAM